MTSREEHITLGKAARDAGDFESAVRHYKEAVALDPNDVSIWLKLTGTYLASENYQTAIETCRETREHSIRERDTGVCLALEARALDQLGKFAEAETSLRASLELLPKSPQLHYDLAVVLSKIDRFDEALSLLDKVMELKPKQELLAQCHGLRGNILGDKEEWEESEREFSIAIGIEPEQGTHYSGLAGMYYDAGEFQKAIETYQKAIQLGCKYSTTYTLLGDAQWHAGDMDGARESFQTALSLDPLNKGNLNHEILLGLAVTEFERDHETARGYLLKSIELNPRYSYAYAELGQIEEQFGDRNKAEEWYLKALELYPSNSFFQRLLAELREETRHGDDKNV